MPHTVPSIDDYIAKSADFESPFYFIYVNWFIKPAPRWKKKLGGGFPHFNYKGEMMCSMAAFKQHAVFGFWKVSLMKDPVPVAIAKSEVAMGHLGRITSLKDLPEDKK